jgi:hypothetical protein
MYSPKDFQESVHHSRKAVEWNTVLSHVPETGIKAYKFITGTACTSRIGYIIQMISGGRKHVEHDLNTVIEEQLRCRNIIYNEWHIIFYGSEQVEWCHGYFAKR